MRPRSHELETESRRAFDLAMPVEWVVRNVPDDYGVDKQVEIFDSSSATGLQFLVQLKATDGESADALVVRLDEAHLNYYEALSLPVLLVRYIAPSGNLYARWVHRVERCRTTASTAIRFSDSDRLSGESPSEILAEVEAVRRLTSANVGWPLTVKVRSENTRPTANELAVACRSAAGEAARFLHFAGSTTGGAAPSVELIGNEACVHFGVSSMTIHDLDTTDELGEIATDIVCAAGLVLGRIGQFDAASKLLQETLASSRLSQDPELFLGACRILFNGGRFHVAAVVAEELRSRAEPHLATLLLATVALADSRALSTVERQRFAAYLRDVACSSLSEGDNKNAATAHYTLGNWLFNNAEYEEALSSFRAALEEDRDYRFRPHFMREIAAAFFENHDFESAITWYGNYISANPGDPHVEACLGDSLMYAGRYSEALEHFDKYLALEDDPSSVWLLKHYALAEAVLASGLELQERDQELAAELLERASTSDDSEPELYGQAIRADALSPEAWFELGRHFVNEADDPQSAIAPLVHAALLDRTADVWVDTAMTALISAPPLFEHCLRTSIADDREGTYLALTRRMAQWPAHLADKIFSLFAHLEIESQRRRGFTLRFITDNGVEEVNVFEPLSERA